MTDLTFAFANKIGYSDVEPYAVANRVNAKTLVITPMTATRADDGRDMGFAPGGFVGHFANQDAQRWHIERGPEVEFVHIRLHKDGRWYDRDGGRYALAAAPRKFYDFNF